MKHIFRYVVGAQDLGILFGPNKTSSLVWYTNSNFSGCLNCRKSTSRYFFQFGHEAISWRSKLQECTGTSTTKVKYVVACNLTKEALWLDRLAYTFPQADPNLALAIINDSQGALAWVMNSVHHNASKHIEV